MTANDNPERPVDLEQWFAAASIAAPAVGAIILLWSALETVMNQMLIGIRIREASEERRDVKFKLSHKPRERVNEWIRKVLPASGRSSEGDAFREEFMRLKTVRDNLAHNIQAMWLTNKTQICIMAMFDRKDYEKETEQWLDRAKVRGGRDDKDRRPSPYGSALYRDADILVAHAEMRELLKFVNETHKAPGLPYIRSARDEGLTPVQPPEGNL